ncbi:unnamed protein product [Urochloa decumbens]|uniref:Dirigent protein n=1 Tax=Urochloa decumbens TaxID=240449 RepID=A0ABC9E9C8_9POAL
MNMDTMTASPITSHLIALCPTKMFLLSPDINPGYIPATSISQVITMASFAKPRHLLLLPVAVIALSLAAAADARRRRPVHLRLYMHDIIDGPEQTAIHLIRNAGPPHESLKGAWFGDTMAIDDPVTEGLSIIGSGSGRVVGKAQGTYMLSSQREEVLVAAVTVALTDGPYGGSTFAVAGRVRIYDDAAELAVVGGTGKLRRAAGHVVWRTAKVVSEVYIVVELIVDMSVPASTVAPGNGSIAIE